MKTHFSRILEKSGTNMLFSRLNKGRTKILLYHSIVKKELFNATRDSSDQCLTDEEFEKQMRYLNEHCNVISLDDFFNAKQDRNKLNVVVTFDDGFLNNYTIAYPILKKYNIKATFFITTSFLSGEGVPWFLRVPNEAKKAIRNLPFEEFEKRVNSFNYDPNDYFQPMDWEHLIELSEDPLISVGSHCKTHYPLTVLPTEKLTDELKGSKEILERKLKKKVDYISYPHGIFNENIIEMTKKSGYKAAITTLHGFNSDNIAPYRMRRNEIGNRGDLNILSSVLSGSWDFFRQWTKKY